MKLHLLALGLLLAPALLLRGAEHAPQDAPEPASAKPTVDQAAPTFRLNDHTGKAVKIGPGERWSVLAFFPKAATPG